MIIVINLRKSRKNLINSFTASPICIGSMLLGNSSCSQSIFNFLGIIGYPTLYTLLEITKIMNAVSPYSLSEFYRCYNHT